MLRRPTHAGPVAFNNLRLLALLLTLPIVPFGEAKSDQVESLNAHRLRDDTQVIGRRSAGDGNAHRMSPAEGDRVIRNPAATAYAKQQTPTDYISVGTSHAESIDNSKDQQQPQDASAIATLALGNTVRAPSDSRRLRSGHPSSLDSSAGLTSFRRGGTTGISTPQAARRLEDWEVEDFVLLATVDGDLYASDRITGEERWHLEVEQPMVETTHHRANNSILDDDYNPVDHYLWAVEPNKDGGLYLWMPESGVGLIRTGFTMKKLVEELSPFSDEDPPVVYTGDKKTTMVTLDAATGRVLKWFGAGGAQVYEQDESCTVSDANAFDNAKCSNSGTITLGRTEYTVSIQRKDGRDIATLKYSEWGPNNFDNDLLQQYSSTMDNRYITSHHDGRVYGLSYDEERSPPHFNHKFPAPVARVFDIARPWEAPAESNPELVVLPQPPPPVHDEEVAMQRNSQIFLNQTSEGSWYAMSGRAYPLVLTAPAAEISQGNFWERQQYFDPTSPARLSKALVGKHSLGRGSSGVARSHYPSLPDRASPPQLADPDLMDNITPVITEPPEQPSTLVDKVKLVPIVARNKVVEFIFNPVWVIVMVTFFLLYRNEIRRWVRDSINNLVSKKTKVAILETVKQEEVPTVQSDVKPDAAVDESIAVAKVAAEDGEAVSLVQDEAPMVADPVIDADATPLASITETEAIEQNPSQSSETAVIGPSPQKEKKAHRGRRGGAKHKKGKNKQTDEASSQSNENAIRTVEEAVQNAKTLGPKEGSLEPDIQTLANGVEEITNPVLKIMDTLQVNEDQQLGTGSNGTVVYSGVWDGRPVAVKRMLKDFYDIASQETKLLRESDDHPNVIRYYAQQSRGNFIYIALELCKASLADVVDKPSQHRELALAGEKDMPSVLYQIANGLDHLHGLRIVHRDLKPQNILVNMQANGKPRILVSDFGLCKKLEGGQSSFGATTAHAAGTSGWRAPELLLDDDSRDRDPITLVDAVSSTHSGTGSNSILSPELVPRRATRSIDIFSLGLVFYYVLTKGSHPFDCGDRYMREVNIRKDNFNLDKLEVLGDYAFEAEDLIKAMIKANPQERPSTQEVMAHPFFWTAKKRLSFLCDVSDHFEKEPRDPPSEALSRLESYNAVCHGDFLKRLPQAFVDSLGKQRKYTGTRVLDLLRALRNKRNHYEDMPEALKKVVGPLPEGYLGFWATRFPSLLLVCWNAVYDAGWETTDRFREYYVPAGL